MFRRARWMVLGAGVGLGSRWWAQRQARRALAQFGPAQVGRKVVQSTASRLRSAGEGARAAMAETEARLRGRGA